MIKNISITLGFITLFLLSLMFFLPKTNLYFLAEQYLLDSKSLVSTEESIKEKNFSLDLENLIVYANEKQITTIKNIHSDWFLFYNQIELQEINLTQNLEKKYFKNINNIKLVYSLLNPLKITISGDGVFGKIYGEVSLIDKQLNLYITPTPQTKISNYPVFNTMEKNEKGVYSYEYQL